MTKNSNVQKIVVCIIIFAIIFSLLLSALIFYKSFARKPLMYDIPPKDSDNNIDSKDILKEMNKNKEGLE